MTDPYFQPEKSKTKTKTFAMGKLPFKVSKLAEVRIAKIILKLYSGKTVRSASCTVK